MDQSQIEQLKEKSYKHGFNKGFERGIFAAILNHYIGKEKEIKEAWDSGFNWGAVVGVFATVCAYILMTILLCAY